MTFALFVIVSICTGYVAADSFCLSDSDISAKIANTDLTDIIPKTEDFTIDVSVEINELSVVAHTHRLHVDIQLIERWQDDSLSYSEYTPCHNVIDIGKHKSKIWRPHEMFSNGVDVKRFEGTEVMMLSSNGTLILNRRFLLNIPCHTHATSYPFGNTSCTLIWKNQAATRDNYFIRWDKNSQEEFLKSPELKEVGDMRFLSADFEATEQYGAAGVFDELSLNIHFQRGHKKILLLFYLPSIMFMIVALLSVALGPMAITRSVLIMTSFILLIIHYISNMAGLPETTGITAIDIWKLFSFFFDLLILCELIVITLMASLGRSRRWCGQTRRKGQYHMEPLYEELNDLRARQTRRTCGCCRYSALILDFMSLWFFAILLGIFSFIYYLKSDVAVKYLNDFNLDDLKVF